MAEVNTALVSGYFQNGGNIMPTLDFWRQLALQFMENTIGTEPGDIGRPMWVCRKPEIVEFKLEKVPNYHGKWLASEKNQNDQAEMSEAALQKPFIMRQLDQDLFHMKQRDVSMLWVLLR